MRGRQGKWRMRRDAGLVVAAFGVCIFASALFAFHPADAADLQGRTAGGRVAAAPGIAAHGPCEMVPQPHANLEGEVIGYQPSLVCLSRGLYADRHPPPPPPPRPWWWLGW